MSNFETRYQPLAAYNDHEEETPQEEDVMIHVVPESSKARWNHIDDLDSFFMRVYQYHQRHGFNCMVVQDIAELIQFAFTVLFPTILLQFVDYDILFRNKPLNGVPFVNGTYTKSSIFDIFIPLSVGMVNFPGWLIACLIIAAILWVLRILKVVYNFFQYQEIKSFYTSAMKISASDLDNMTWYEVQRKMQEIQSEQQMCIHKAELTELDIYHRILRFKNYMVAMVNKSLLPVKFSVPFLGEVIYFSKGLQYNFGMILFYGPGAPFENSWHLKDDYKKIGKRKELADKLSKRILWFGIANIALSVLIFLWQILYFFFSYADLVKREPSKLSARQWSAYGRLYVRHFNELDHELNARLNRAHRLSTGYMNSFSSPMMAIIAKTVVFIAGSVLAVSVLLTFWDEDTLHTEYFLLCGTILGVLILMFRSFIPDENLIFCPERQMTTILSHIHYMPDHWKGNAHTTQVRDEFAQLFQYKAVYLLEQLLSPLATPLILIFYYRHKSLDIVDFFRNFTVNVVGVGDVCSFAQMDLKKHGNPTWLSENYTQANHYVQAEDGKIELSLLHFTTTNPDYRLPQEANAFMNQLKDHAMHDLEMMQTLQEENSLSYSLHSVSLGIGYAHLMSSFSRPVYPATVSGQDPNRSGVTGRSNPVLIGAISRTEGPINGSPIGLLNSVHQAMSQSTTGSNSMMNSYAQQGADAVINASMNPSTRHLEAGAVEMNSQEMSFNALYLRELHHRGIFSKAYANNTCGGRMSAYNLWHRPSNEASVVAGGATAMPSIQEAPSETDDRAEKLPLLDAKFSRSS